MVDRDKELGMSSVRQDDRARCSWLLLIGHGERMSERNGAKPRQVTENLLGERGIPSRRIEEGRNRGDEGVCCSLNMQ